jgi:hypothetical protein
MTRRDTISKNYGDMNKYEAIEEAVKEESYYVSRKSIDRSLFASDKKMIKLEDNEEDKWVEDIEEKQGVVGDKVNNEVNEVNEVSQHNTSMNIVNTEGNNKEQIIDDVRNKETENVEIVVNEDIGDKVLTKDPSTKTNLDQIEEKDQDYIDFNISKPEENISIEKSVTKPAATVAIKEKNENKPTIEVLKRRTSITYGSKGNNPNTKKSSDVLKLNKPEDIKVKNTIIQKPYETRSSFGDFKKKGEIAPSHKTSSNKTAPTSKPKPVYDTYSDDTVKVLFRNYSPERSRKHSTEDEKAGKVFSLERKLTIVEQVIIY